MITRKQSSKLVLGKMPTVQILVLIWPCKRCPTKKHNRQSFSSPSSCQKSECKKRGIQATQWKRRKNIATGPNTTHELTALCAAKRRANYGHIALALLILVCVSGRTKPEKRMGFKRIKGVLSG